MRELFIDGAWVDGGGPEITSIDPATGTKVWEGREASKAQVDDAVAAARGAFSMWRSVPLEKRIETIRRFARLVEEHRDGLARMISLETGKPTWEALTEVASMIGKVEITIVAHAERTGTRERQMEGFRSVVRHQPHGVMGVLGPYNFPGHLPNGHIVPALVAGNTAVLKPSEHATATAIEVVKLWEQAGLPSGVLNLVVGAKDTGGALVSHPQLDGLLFTGSAAAGAQMHRTCSGRPETILALEMGGNNPLVVDEVDDLAAAVYVVVQSAYVTAGQRCTCARRLFVPRSSFGARVAGRLIEAVQSLRVGRFDDSEEPFMGPVISEAAADQLLDAQSRLIDLGGSPLVEMRKLRRGTGLVSPALIDVTGVEDLPDEEHFGPLLRLHYYDDFARAIDQANATRFGLAAGLISEDPNRWQRFLGRIRAGVVNWNRPLTGASSAAPFGGVGASGNHRPSAYYAADYCAYPVASLEQESITLPETLPPGMTL
jgi:succinylglutamic semialdehyde dehydrogenase